MKSVVPKAKTQDGNFVGSVVDIPVRRRESIVVKIKAARSVADNNRDLVSAIFIIIMQTLLFTVLLALSLALPVAKIIAGAVNFYNCPAQPLIPLYLVVSGGVSAVFDVIIIMLRLLIKTEKEYTENSDSVGIVFCLSSIANIGLMVFGSVVVFPLVFHFSHDMSSKDYCQPFVFWFTFWMLLLHILIASFVLVATIGVVCLMIIMPSDPEAVIDIRPVAVVQAPTASLEDVEVAEDTTKGDPEK